ncbi:MAG: hypothetical protein R3234_10255 [Thermoanaerobaculia bacterium]|nr:hypothetical protein [Thermoanaerobaculia bacterium]
MNLARAALVAVLLIGISASPLLAEKPAEERIEALEQEIQELKGELETLREEKPRKTTPDGEGEAAQTSEGTEERLQELERRLGVLARELEDLRLGEVAAEADRSQYGYGPAASKIYRTEEGLSIGGYGEMIYESVDGGTDEFDFLRGIVYFGYKFNDRWLFNSEIEFEHASTGADGSASVEFAYLDYLHRPAFNVRAGLLLVPMGFINELHEPTVFLGAQRPVTESVIIPTTWRENGFGLFGEIGPVSYRSYVVNGLEGAEFSAGGLRGGRQKGSKALADDFAWVTRADYGPVPGLQLGGSFYLGDSGQDLTGPGGASVDVGTTILEAHAEYSWRGFELRALGAWAELDDVAALNAALGLTGSASVGEELQGAYLQAGFDVLTLAEAGEAQLTPFVRWEQVNTQDSVPAGFGANPANDREILTLGLDYKPIDQVVLKVDYQDVSNEADTGNDQINVGIGYIF